MREYIFEKGKVVHVALKGDLTYYRQFAVTTNSQTYCYLYGYKPTDQVRVTINKDSLNISVPYEKIAVRNKPEGPVFYDDFIQFNSTLSLVQEQPIWYK